MNPAKIALSHSYFISMFAYQNITGNHVPKMKEKNKWLLFFCALFLGCIQNMKAQTEKPPPLPPLNFTINAGYGLPNLNQTYYESQGSGSASGSFNPIYLEIGYNYSKKGLVSLYLSDATGTTGTFKWLDTASVSHTYSYDITIFTIGVSTKYYFTCNTHFAPYIGGMIGYNFTNFSQAGDIPAFGAANVNTINIAYHVYAGATYYLNNWLGLDARIGYGNSYYAGLGLSFKFKIKQEYD